MISKLTMAGFLALVLIAGMVPAYGAKARSPQHSTLNKINGVPTLIVDGQPFLVVGAQCDVWRSTPQDAKTIDFFDSYRDINATTVGLDVLWDKCEHVQDKYDFTLLDWFVKQARSRHLKVALQLFNSNVCGGITDSKDWTYTPSYILSAPDKYQRMVLPWDTAPSGTPMCPNDPSTLERERKYLVKLAEHLRDTDYDRTVIMLQIDNEFGYRKPRNQPRDEVRCQCKYCDAKYDRAKYGAPEVFMFKSFAAYTKVLSDAITKVYDLPLYVNSPWWPTYAIPIFLDACPNVDMVGIDGIVDPTEPNMLSKSQLGRNIPFAAENATPNPRCRTNLDVLPYYTIVGQFGIGNLLWETPLPGAIIGNPVLRKRYGDAMYPIKNAQWAIAKTRGTKNVIGWYIVREFPADKKNNSVLGEKMFVREGQKTRMEATKDFTAAIDKHKITISGSAAGIIASPQPNVLVIATAKADLTISGPAIKTAEEGVYVGDKWKPAGKIELKRNGDAYELSIAQPKVIRLLF